MSRNVPITYRKSFLAKYILSDDRVKEVYTILKNRLLQIEGMKSRISWFYDAFNVGRLNFAKLSVRGKYVALYINLDTKDYPENIYHQEDVSDRRRYKDTSFKIHVKSNRTIRYAFRLIDDCIKKFNLTKGVLPNEDYYLEYEDEEPLVKRGLIEIVEPTRYTYRPKVQIPVDTKIKEENDFIFEEDNKIQVIFVDGSKVFIKERKSFEAKLIQSSPETQYFYNVIKNRLLSFTKVKSKISWKYESFTLNKVKLAKLQIRGRYLVLYLALDMKKYPKERRLEDSSKYSLFKDTPVTLRIKDNTRLEFALDLIDDLRRRFLLEEGFLKEDHDYSKSFENDEELKNKGLIKVYAKFGDPDVPMMVQRDDDDKKNINFNVYKEVSEYVLSIDENNEFKEVEEIVKVPLNGVKDIVYLDVLNDLFNEDDVITLDLLKERKLLSNNVDYYKVIYRGGTITKKLHIVSSAQTPIVEKIVTDLGGKFIIKV